MTAESQTRDGVAADPVLHTGGELVLREATFNPKVRTYWLLSGAWILTATLVGIPLLILWFPLGYVITGRYLARLGCVLTEKNLHVARGVLIRQGKDGSSGQDHGPGDVPWADHEVLGPARVVGGDSRPIRTREPDPTGRHRGSRGLPRGRIGAA